MCDRHFLNVYSCNSYSSLDNIGKNPCDRLNEKCLKKTS